MEDLFKKFVNAGVGYLAQGNKKVQSTIDKLVKDSKLTEKEGQKIVAELLKSGETKRAELEKQFLSLADRLKTSVGLGDAKAGTAKKATASSKTASKPTVSKSSSAKVAAPAPKTAAGTGAAKKPAAKPAVKKPAAPAAKAAGQA